MNPNLLSMAGRVALVTGAGLGVGRQVALHFASHDAHAVIVNDFYQERAEKTAQEIRALGVEARPCRSTSPIMSRSPEAYAFDVEEPSA